ncbi:VCBS domain-containing protein, partial [Chitinivorax tropicus]
LSDSGTLTTTTLGVRFVASQQSGSYGQFSVDASGAWHYTLDNAQPAVQALKTGDSQLETFTVALSDGSTTTVTITVTGLDDGAIISGTDHGSVTEDTTLLSTGQLTLTDPDAGQAAFQPATLTGQYGTLTLDATGKWSYALDNASAQVQDLTATDTKLETFSVTSIDGTQHAISVQVKGTEDTNSIGNGAVQEDVKLSHSGTLTSTNPSATFVANTVNSNYGTFTVDATGKWTYDLHNDDAAVQALKAGQRKIETFVVNLSNHTSTVVSVDVLGSNDAPTLVADTNQINEDFTLSVTAANGVLKNDSDLDGEPLTVTGIASGNTAGTVGKALVGQFGTLTIKADGSYIYKAGAAAQALSVGMQVKDVFTYTAIDGQGGAKTTTLTITVTGLNDAPVAEVDEIQITEDSTVIKDKFNGVLKNDRDVEGDTLTVTGVRFENTTGKLGTPLAGEYGSLILNADGSYTYTPNANAQALNSNDVGVERFTYTISDGKGGTATQSLNIIIIGEADAPVLDLDANDSTAAGSGFVTTFYEKQGGIPIADIDARITDVDSAKLAGATITLANAQVGDELLVGTLPTGITATLTSTEVRLKGVGTLADYTQAIKAIMFNNGNASLSDTPRQIHVSVDDGTTTSRIATTTINVAHKVDLAVKDVGHWTFDEGSGATTRNVYDRTPKIGHITDNPGGPAAATAFTTGRDGTTAIQFNGRNGGSRDGGYVALDKSVTDPLRGDGAGGGSASLTFWIKTTQIGASFDWNAPSVIGTEGRGQRSDIQWGWLDNTGKICFGIGDLAGIRSTTAINDGQWHHVAITHDFTSGATAVWVDGAMSNTGNIAPRAILSNSFLGFGVTADSSAAHRYLNGALDDVRIYDRTLTADQIKAIFAVENNLLSQHLVLDNDGGPVRFAVTAEDHTSVTISGIPAGTQLTDGLNTKTITNAGEIVDITGWDFNQLALTGLGNQSAMLAVTATGKATGDTQIHMINIASSANIVMGTDDANTLTGTSNADYLSGGAGDDTVAGGGGDDRLLGGRGNDILTGGLGADVFKWSLTDAGTPSAPARDTLTDFSVSTAVDSNDKLDLRDLLQGENHLPGAGNLGHYLHFEKSGGDTILHVNHSGAFSTGFSAAKDTQVITFQGIDLTAGGTSTDAQIIQDLLNKGKLITD